jgi:hypothetical protein
LNLDPDTDECHILSNQYGRILRSLAGFIQVSKEPITSHMVARAALYHLLLQTRPDKAEEARAAFPFNESHLGFVEDFLRMIDRTRIAKEKKKTIAKHVELSKDGKSVQLMLAENKWKHRRWMPAELGTVTKNQVGTRGQL